MFTGSMVALVTPMNRKGEIDQASLYRLVEIHVQAGTAAIVVTGTTGEGATLSASEKFEICVMALDAAKGRIPIIAGTGAHSTLESIYQTEQALKVGVAACLVVTPYYNRPTQEGLYQHYLAIAKAVPIPIILYNVPKRTACDLLPETVARLVDVSNIVGLKDATGDLARGRELVAICKDKISLYSGDDSSALAFILQGGKGVISVTANLAPKMVQEICVAALASNIGLAGTLNNCLMPLHKALTVESNPIPVKWAMQELGWIQDGIRLPLTPLSELHHEGVREAMKNSGVVYG